jgi:hypothetical protein
MKIAASILVSAVAAAAAAPKVEVTWFGAVW